MKIYFTEEEELQKLLDKVGERFKETEFSKDVKRRTDENSYQLEQHRDTKLKHMQDRTAMEIEASKTVPFENESVVSFTSVHDGESIGGSKTATNVQSSGDTDVNQHESAEKDQPRDNSLSSAKGAFSKSYHDAEREAMMQMGRNNDYKKTSTNACISRKNIFSYSLNKRKENTKKRCDDLKKKRNFTFGSGTRRCQYEFNRQKGIRYQIKLLDND